MNIKKRKIFLKEIQKIFYLNDEKSNLKFHINECGEIIDCIMDNKKKLVVSEGIINFTTERNYTENFGFQWNKFRKTQLDSYNLSNISENRFLHSTNWNPKDLKNKLILDIGCGTGRFSEIALKYGAKVISIDYSQSVKATKKNLKKYTYSLVIQGDVYNLPLKQNSFDYVFCLGVLQHTPDVEKAFKSLPIFLKSGGSLCVDYYWKRLRTLLNSKYLIRYFTKNMDNKKLWKLLNIIHPYLYFVSNLIIMIPILGKPLTRIIPVSNYKKDYKLNKEQLKIWSLLDTFDALSPLYDNPQKPKEIKKWAKDLNLKKIEVLHAGHLVLRAIK